MAAFCTPWPPLPPQCPLSHIHSNNKHSNQQAPHSPKKLPCVLCYQCSSGQVRPLPLHTSPLAFRSLFFARWPPRWRQRHLLPRPPPLPVAVMSAQPPRCLPLPPQSRHAIPATPSSWRAVLAVFLSRPLSPCFPVCLPPLVYTFSSAWLPGCRSPRPRLPARLLHQLQGRGTQAPPLSSPFLSSRSMCNSRIVVLGLQCPPPFIVEAVCQPGTRSHHTHSHTCLPVISFSVTPFAIVRLGCNTSFRGLALQQTDGGSYEQGSSTGQECGAQSLAAVEPPAWQAGAGRQCCEK